MAASPEITSTVHADTRSSGPAEVVFHRHGLGSSGLWGMAGIPADEAADSGPAGLANALAELGGLYGVFAFYLNGRADLLGGSYLSYLRAKRSAFPAISRAEVAATVRRELGSRGEEIARVLSEAPEWSTVFRTAYRSTVDGRAIFVEVARPAVSAAAMDDFERGIRSIGHPDLTSLVSPGVAEQFRDWVRNGESLDRERSFLDVLANFRGDTLVDYPALIPELCTPSVLCWPVVDGRPLAELLAEGNANAPVLAAMAVLEQFFSLSMVEANLDPDAMRVDAANRLHIRRLDNPLAVLPGVIDTGLKYAAAVLSGNAPRSAQTLIRLMIARPPLDLEKQLTEEFSAIEPELKINRWFPATAAAFESNWRALARVAPSRPLFLDCLHRNLLTAGYWNSDAVRGGAPAIDAISEAMWPVIGKLIRTQTGTLMSKETAQEWAFGSGLLMFGTFREMNRMVEELRESDLSVGVDCSDWRRPARQSNGVGYQILLGMLALLFLACVQWGGAVAEPWSLAVKIVAVITLPAMFWAASKIG